MNTVGYFEIHSSDPKRDIQFYTSVFGWKFTKEDGLPIEYYRIETGSLNGGLLKRPGEKPGSEDQKNGFVCSILVRDFDKMSDLIIKSGGKMTIPRFAVPNKCWQGYFSDPDNNTFGIFQVDENAK